MIAAVEIYAQVQPLKRKATVRGLSLQVEKLDVAPSERLFDYSKLAFPRAQYDPEIMIKTMTAVVAGEIDSYRNLEPKSMTEETKKNIEAPWTKKTREGLGTRPANLQKCYEMQPETPMPFLLAICNRRRLPKLDRRFRGVVYSGVPNYGNA